jgi:predicted GTPase
MSRWRIIVFLVLLLGPILFLAGLGVYSLVFDRHWRFWAWWPMTACTAIALFLGWRWQRSLRLLGRPEIDMPLHWTERDQEAWKVVEARAKQAATIDPQKFTDLIFYTTTAHDMALELARAYHPHAADPVGSLTIPELLTAAELASHDLGEMVDRYLPAGHLLTIDHWRKTRQAADLYQKASNLTWLIYSLFSPVETGARFAASKFGISMPWQKLQHNLLLWFYTAYVNRVGAYLIELHSGRLRVGVRRYRELVLKEKQSHQPVGELAGDGQVADQVAISVIGQTKVGKSSFINAVLGSERAHTDVVRATKEITRYDLNAPDGTTRLACLDTVGYAHTGAKEDQIKATQQAAQESDLLVLVLHARNPARSADVELLRSLRSWYASRPDLKLPPTVAVLTHIDLLSPAMEWNPPYDWHNPKRPKEEQIAQAVAAVKEQLGEFLDGCIPVCTAPERVYGIDEWFLPALTDSLDEARAVALLRCLRKEAHADRFRKVLRQVTAAGIEAAKVLWHAQKK